MPGHIIDTSSTLINGVLNDLRSGALPVGSPVIEVDASPRPVLKAGELRRS